MSNEEREIYIKTINRFMKELKDEDIKRIYNLVQYCFIKGEKNE